MKAWQVAWIIIGLSVVSFSLLFLRADIPNFDTYYFLSIACDKTQAYQVPLLAEAFFLSAPCSFLFFKTMSLILIIASTFILWQVAKLFFPQQAWIAPIIIFLSPFWVLEFTKIEDDPLSYPFLFAALWFYFKAKLDKKPLYLLGTGLCFALALMLWKGALIYFPVILFGFPLLIPLAVIAWFFLNLDIGRLEVLLPNLNVQENLPFIGILHNFTLNLGVIGFQKTFMLEGAWFLLLALLNAKFAIHAAFFLALGGVFVFHRLEKIAKEKQHQKALKYLKTGIVVYCFVFAFSSSILIWKGEPNQNQLEAVKYAIQQADGNTVITDWSYGYLILFYGGTPSHYGGGIGYVPDANKGFVVLSEDQKACQKLRTWEHGFYDVNINVYRC